MAFDFFKDILTPLIVGGGASGFVVLLGKHYVETGIQHTFNQKIETYKTELERGNISFQIDKTESAKRRFENITNLYLKALELKRRTRKSFNLMTTNTLLEIRSRFNANEEFHQEFEDEIAVSSLILDVELIKLFSQFQLLSQMHYMTLVQIAENEVLAKDENQKQYLNLRVVMNDDYDRGDTFKSMNETSKLVNNTFEELTKAIQQSLNIN